MLIKIPSSGKTPLPSYCVGDSSAGDLSKYAGNLAGREGQTDALLSSIPDPRDKKRQMSQSWSEYFQSRSLRKSNPYRLCRDARATHPVKSLGVVRDLNSEWTVSRAVAHQANRRESREWHAVFTCTPCSSLGCIDWTMRQFSICRNFWGFRLPAAMPGVLGISMPRWYQGSRLKNGTRFLSGPVDGSQQASIGNPSQAR